MEWKDTQLLSQPSRQRGWIFRSKTEATSFCFAFEDDIGEYITVSQFFHAMKKPHQKLIRAAGSSLKQSKLWTSINGAKGAKASSADVAPTQLDNEDEEMPLPDPSDTVDAEMTNEHKRTSEEVHTAKASPSKKKSHMSYLNRMTDPRRISKDSISVMQVAVETAPIVPYLLHSPFRTKGTHKKL